MARIVVGLGGRVRDLDGDEDDGYDECMFMRTLRVLRF